MYEWGRIIQDLVLEMDRCIKAQDWEGLTLSALARKLSYSEYHLSHRFRDISGMQLRDYLRGRLRPYPQRLPPLPRPGGPAHGHPPL